MPNEINYYAEEVNGKIIEKTLLVTISLEEYRSLVQENERYSKRIEYLENRLVELTALKGGVCNAE